MRRPERHLRNSPASPFLAQPFGPPVPIVWTAHSDVDQVLLLEALARWIDWLTDRYPLDHRVVPDCWAEHSELIEEFSALHLAWQVAYASTSSADSALTWHERFAVARLRIGEWVARTGCRAGSHRELLRVPEGPAE